MFGLESSLTQDSGQQGGFQRVWALLLAVEERRRRRQNAFHAQGNARAAGLCPVRSAFGSAAIARSPAVQSELSAGRAVPGGAPRAELPLGVPAGLAHCRHLSTVRTHLSALVNHSIVPPDRPACAAAGLTKELWSKYQKDRKVSDGPLSVRARAPHAAVPGRTSPAVGPMKYGRCLTTGSLLNS